MVKIKVHFYAVTASMGLSLSKTVDYTNYIVRCDKIHDVLELNDCEFQWSNFGFEVYDALGSLYNTFMANRTDNVFAEVLYESETIFFGRLKTNTPIIDTRNGTMRFECEHIISDLANENAIRRNYEYLKFKESSMFGGFIVHYVYGAKMFNLDLGVVKFRIEPNQFVSFDQSAITTYEGQSILPVNLYIGKDAVEEGIDHLTFLGNVMRSLGYMFYWKNNVVYAYQRSSFLTIDSSVIDLTENQVIGLDEIKAWELMASRVVIKTTDLAGNALEITGPYARRPYYRRSNDSTVGEKRVIVDRRRSKIVKTVEAPYLASIIYSRGSSNSWIDGDTVLHDYLINMYTAYFCRNAQQINLTLEGIDWTVGEKVHVPVMDRTLLIQETYKDLADMSTEIVGVTIDEKYKAVAA